MRPRLTQHDLKMTCAMVLVSNAVIYTQFFGFLVFGESFFCTFSFSTVLIPKILSIFFISRSLLFKKLMMSMRHHFLIISFYVGLCQGYAAFIYPGHQDQYLTFNYVDIVYFTWTTSIAEPYMNLWCSPNSSVSQSDIYRKSYARSDANDDWIKI